jgi:signal peptidase I
MWERVFIQLLKVAAVLFGVFVVGRIFFFEPYGIPAGSMKPTLLVGDYVLVSRLSYGYSKYSYSWFRLPIDGRLFGALPQRGDVAVFALPRDPSVSYIKRIVGLPGDRIQMIDGVLNINGQPVGLERIADGYDPDYRGHPSIAQFIETLPNGLQHPIFKHEGINPLDNTTLFVVPEGKVFTMGDNRDNSLDSRVPPREDGVGFVPLENLVGRAEIRWFSFENQVPWWYGPFGIRYSRLFTGVH